MYEQHHAWYLSKPFGEKYDKENDPHELYDIGYHVQIDTSDFTDEVVLKALIDEKRYELIRKRQRQEDAKAEKHRLAILETARKIVKEEENYKNV